MAQAFDTLRELIDSVSNPADRTVMAGKLDEARGAFDGGQNVDFTSLIDLIRATVDSGSWDNAGGSASVREFPGGVYVDSTGLLRQRLREAQPDSEELARLRNARSARAPSDDAARPSPLRRVSLPKLEREVARRLDAGERLPPDIRYLAGLERIDYVFVYPDERDIVIAGPAGGWRFDELGRAVCVESGRPVMQLDDLVVALRAAFARSDTAGIFGCGIYPRADRLAEVQRFLDRSAAAGPINPNQRDRWLGNLRDQLGAQDIQVFGVPAASRVAHVMVEADYRMKLIGIGLEAAAVAGIPNYFELLGEPSDERLARDIDTLRWWFTLNYDAVIATPEGDAFEFQGPRVKVLCENELLTPAGERVHTGQADAVNTQFARNFSRSFAELAAHDVNFADLANVFDSAVLAAMLRGRSLPQSIDWPMTTFLDSDEFVIAEQHVPREVETVMNHRVYRGRHILAVISGGIHVNPWQVVSRDRLRPDDDGRLARTRAAIPAPASKSWWSD